MNIITCPDCGDPILAEDFALSQTRLGSDPFPEIIARIFPDGYFSDNSIPTAIKPENRLPRIRRGRFNRTLKTPCQPSTAK